MLVPTTVMPKGVEHQSFARFRPDRRRRADHSDAEGVEHMPILQQSGIQFTPTTVMPKGVEHGTVAGTSGSPS